MELRIFKIIATSGFLTALEAKVYRIRFRPGLRPPPFRKFLDPPLNTNKHTAKPAARCCVDMFGAVDTISNKLKIT